MTMLAALARHYDRLAEKGEAPPFGYSRTRVSFCVVLRSDGTPMHQPVDLRDLSAKRPVGQRLELPTPLIQRTSGKSANFLWDKSAYSLGVTAEQTKRTADEHASFVRLHRDVLWDASDEGLLALMRFIEHWTPSQFESLSWPAEMVDQNIVFALESEHRERLLHQRPAARTVWAKIMESMPATKATCLATGHYTRIARSHPPIKGVWDAQSSGAFIVSFNAPAFVSYGQEGGDNGPVGEPAAFAYTTVLNRLLESDSRNRIQIGDASTVFWAEAEDAESAEVAELVFGSTLGMPIDEAMQAGRVRPILDGIAKGRPLRQLDPKLAEGVRFYVLGLSPNAARLSVRFWFEGTFGHLADSIAAHARDMALDPAPREDRPSIRRLLIETAVRHKSENISPQLAGEILRAILSGGRYPATLLSTILMRLRADGEVSPLRVALLKAIVTRNRRLDAFPTTEEPPVSYDPACKEAGYLLGQLFAVYEYAQSAALGRSINATVKDKFYGAAATTPQGVFPMLDRSSVPHLAKLRKLRPGQAVNIDKQIAEIMERLAPGTDPFPRSLPPAQQALFALGYYHQRNRRFADKPEHATAEEIA